MPHATRQLGLLVNLDGQGACLSLDRIREVVGFASLAGEPDDFFAGWLDLRGQAVPVFDLGRVLLDKPTASSMGLRIAIVDAGNTTVGLLAAGMHDTVDLAQTAAEIIAWNSFLPMLTPLIPEAPAVR